MKYKWSSEIIGLVGVIAFFILVSYFTQIYLVELQSIMQGYFIVGLFIFFLIMVTSVVFAPVSVLPLIPVASQIWSWPVAGAISLIAWITGSAIDFYISRRYGQPLVKKFVSLDKVRTFERNLSGGYTFWGIVGLRLLLPFDLLNYAFGLFTDIGAWTYLSATFVSEIPHAFVVAYLGSLPFIFELIAVGAGAFILMIVVIYLYWKGKIDL